MKLPEKRITNTFFIICLLGLAYVFVSVIDDIGWYSNNQVRDSVKLGIAIIQCIVVFFAAREYFYFTHTTFIFLIAMSLLILNQITGLTEEFEQFKSVPLLGKKTLAKHVFETILECGSACFFFGGIYFSVFEINKARKQLSADVHRLSEDRVQLKSLASQLSLVEERERRHLAIELHDQIGQSLVFSKLKLDQLCKSAPSDDFSKALEDVCDCLEQIIRETRTLMFDLSSPILYEFGLEAAVAEWLREEIQKRHGIEIEFEDDEQPKPLDDDILALLFRNVRELLVNVVKHAQAHKVKVSIHRNDGDIHISVEDDGIGFDPVEVTSIATKRDEFGLFSIRERLEQLGGLIEIVSEPGRGCRISMTAPLKRTRSASDQQTSHKHLPNV
ncbi:MAG: sensor histidine kinase [Planctomycetes bacterium]|nr:sensor histidine kinase [Planctomycetota bacterium]